MTTQQADLWGPDGIFAKSFAGYVPRREQRQMYAEVVQRLINEEHALIEAGTGTGKGLAYLTPLILLAAKRGAKVGVSASTINLQEQLVNKDVPAAVAALSNAGLIDAATFQVATLKGKNNYLCEENRYSLEDEAPTWPAAEGALDKVANWVTETGDRSELDITQEESLPWTLMSCQYSAGCELYESGSMDCYVTRARKAANDANLVIVNHAMLLADIASNDPHLGQITHWVLDEGHHIEEEASRQFGLEIPRNELNKILEETEKDPVLGYLAGETRKAWAGLWETLTQWLAEQSGRELETVSIKPSTRNNREWDACAQAGEEFTLRAGALEKAASQEGAKAKTLGDTKRESSMHRLVTATGDIRECIRVVVDSHDPQWVTWVEPRSGAAGLIERIPLDVGPLLREKLFGRRRSVIITSATLTTEEGNFEHLAERIGATDAKVLALKSPFDYRRQARLLTPSDMPNPRKRQEYEEATADAIMDIAEELDGHTLALFTSNAAIKSTQDRVARKLARMGIATLAQNIDGSAADLVKRYRANPKAVILGTNSFWEGVDLADPGMLKAVVICKLPFPVPSDPVVEARGELYRDPFLDYMVPMAVMRFRQGFGRLIRNDQSHGAVVVLDPRFDHRKYGRSFQTAIPICDEPIAETRDLGRLVREWQENEEGR